jgi:hypothetical protein
VSNHERTAWPTPWQPQADWPEPQDVNLRWQLSAECRGVDGATSDRLVGANQPADVADLLVTLCAGCPVASACLQAGQEAGADGTWGGHVLAGGKNLSDA